MILARPFWQNLIEAAWTERNIVWLMGVRRVGKTSLCKSLPNVVYFDCEYPRVRQAMEDPEAFLESQRGKRIVLDEIHRLDNPSELLKICADHYPDIKIIATGSSTLGASEKFKDTLAGRKREIWLTPLLLQELEIFGNTDLTHRFLFGGLPALFSAPLLPEDDFRDWMDAYWAKDIQDLFKIGRRDSFQKFAELLNARSGGQFEATAFAGPCEVSRPTIVNYLDVLKETFVVHVIRPYSTYRQNEIVMAPKVYGFDTGFSCYARGWRDIKREDMGLLWEQCVLNEMHGILQTRPIHYWRDKRGHEIDFVVHDRATNTMIAIECKFRTLQEEIGKSMVDSIGNNVEAFRSHYPEGMNYVVGSDVSHSFTRRYGKIQLTFISAQELVARLAQLLIIAP